MLFSLHVIQTIKSKTQELLKVMFTSQLERIGLELKLREPETKGQISVAFKNLIVYLWGWATLWPSVHNDTLCLWLQLLWVGFLISTMQRPQSVSAKNASKESLRYRDAITYLRIKSLHIRVIIVNSDLIVS